jgi:hypothetical protein
MDTTFGEAKSELLRLLKDTQTEGTPVEGNTISAALLQDGIHAALDAIVSRLWKQAVFTVDEDTEEAVADSRSYSLPVACIEIENVYDSHIGEFIPRIEMAIGDALIASSGNGWYTYPSGRITFTAALTDEVSIYYSSLWDKPASDDDVLDPPGMSLTAILFFAASYCLLPGATSSANIRQYNTKVDSGKPVDNTVQDMSSYFMKRFEIELQRIPQMQKGSYR